MSYTTEYVGHPEGGSSMHITNDGMGLPVSSINEMEFLCLERYARGARVLELGAEYGASTILMARVAKLVVSVDWHQGYDAGRGAAIDQKQDTVFNYFYNIKEVRDRVVPVVGRFEDVLPLLADGSFDFVFQDGGHGWEGTKFCFEQALRLCRPGGVIATHDYGHPLCSEKAVLETMGIKVRQPIVGTMAIIDVPL